MKTTLILILLSVLIFTGCNKKDSDLGPVIIGDNLSQDWQLPRYPNTLNGYK